MKLFDENAIAIATLWSEARSEPLEGIMAVGEVIRLRAKLHYNSDGTIIGTCCKKLQFSCWNHDDPQRLRMLKLDWSDPLVRQCKGAWEQSEWTAYANGALLYYAPAGMREGAVPWWAPKCREVARIGGHIFFVED